MQEPSLVASLSLTNTSAGTATPAVTFLPFGHPFAEADAPGTHRLVATWAPDGGAPVAVPVQVSGRASWPDGSLRFAALGVRLPSVPGGGTGTLALVAEPGTQDTTIPGGKTIADVLADLRANFAFTVTAANLVKGHETDTPTTDGSGAWTWAADDQLALHGLTDARGRARCEATRSGPLCVMFACWGPFKDDTGGALHPHLIIRAWYTCWLDSTTGAIDRVEHFHSLEQTWIEDLAGGAVEADLEIGDFAIKLGGVTLSGRSWTGLRVPHHTYHALVPLDGGANDGNLYTGGSTWTSGSLTLRPSFDAAYQVRSGLVPPYDVGYFEANPLVPADTPTPSTWTPGARDSNGRAGNTSEASLHYGINAGGAHDHIGIIPEWSVRVLHNHGDGDLRDDLATAFVAGQIPMRVRNPSTGRIASYLPATELADTSNALMGTNRSTGGWMFNNGFWSADFAARWPETFDPSLTEGTNPDGGWYGSGNGWSPSHWPSLAYHQYLRTGAPWLLETIKLDAQMAIQWRPIGTHTAGFGKARNFQHNDGTITYCRIIRDDYEERNEAWSWKLLAQCLAVLPDDAPERPYFDKVYANNQAGVIRVINEESANFRAIGTWDFRGGSNVVGLQQVYSATPFMQNYLIMARSWEYLALGQPPQTLTFLNHIAKSLKGRLGGQPERPCGWGCVSFHLITGVPSEIGDPDCDYFPDWGMVPYWLGNSDAAFDVATGYISAPFEQSLGAPIINLASSSGWPLRDGDKVMFHPFRGQNFGWGNNPPSNITRGIYYYIRDLDRPNLRYRVAAQPGGPAITPAESVDTVGASYQLATCPTPSAERGSIQERAAADQYAYADMAEVLQSLDTLVVGGVLDNNETWITDYRDRVEITRTVRDWAGSGHDWVNHAKLKTTPSP